jgi:hypothetical protein
MPEDGNRVPKTGITIGTKLKMQKEVFADNPIWKVGTCISPSSVLNLRSRSAFTTLYSPASRELVPGAELI